MMTNQIPKVNEHNEVVGETTVPEALANDWYRRIVRVFVFDEEGKVLLQKRAATVKTFPDYWDQTAGGHIDVGETAAKAAQRETEEEIGITVEPQEVVAAHQTDQPGDRQFNYLYRAVIPGDTTFNYDEDEVAELRWFTIAEFEQQMQEQPDKFVPTFIEIWQTFRDKLLA